jgi:glucose/arabinose dehydrogenase
MKLLLFFTLFLLVFCNGTQAAVQDEDLPLEKIKLPPGFSISLWARVPDVRTLTLGDKGTVFAGSNSAGNVYAITDHNGKRRVRVIASKLKLPSGVAFHHGSLYVSAVNRILHYGHIEENLDQPPQPQVVIDSYPRETFHGWRFIAFGPDDLLYVSVGAPCDACEADQSHYALISRIKPDGTNYEIYAQGVRNSVGFDWHPETKELWFTDIGRDWMSDNMPPDELNHAPHKGMHFGFPYCHASSILDPKFGAKRGCDRSVPPVIELDAHATPLGMRFYTGNMFPLEYKNQIIIAEHGSSNQRTHSGYQLKRVHIENNKVIKKEVFADGWLENGNAWGRPVDVLVMPDGALLVSDDQAGAIYRISYSIP